MSSAEIIVICAKKGEGMSQIALSIASYTKQLAKERSKSFKSQ